MSFLRGCYGNEETVCPKSLQLLALFWANIFGGILEVVTGPVLPNLKQLMEVSEGELALAFSVTVVFAVAGAALTPCLESWLGQSLALGGSLLLCSMATSLSLALSPLFPIFATFLAAYTFLGAMAFTYVHARVYVLYGKEAAFAMHFLSVAIGLGSLMVPFIVRPFVLSPACLQTDNVTTVSGVLSDSKNLTTDASILSSSSNFSTSSDMVSRTGGVTAASSVLASPSNLTAVQSVLSRFTNATNNPTVVPDVLSSTKNHTSDSYTLCSHDIHTAEPKLAPNSSTGERFLRSIGCNNNVFLVYVIVACLPVPSAFVFLYVAVREKWRDSLLDEETGETYGTFSMKESPLTKSHENDIETPAREQHDKTSKRHPQLFSQNEADTKELIEIIESNEDKIKPSVPCDNIHETKEKSCRNPEAPKPRAIETKDKPEFSRWTYSVFVLLLSLANMVTYSGTAAFSNYLTVFGMQVFGLPQVTMGFMTSMAMGCFTVGRVVGTVLSLYVGPGTLMAGSLGMMLGSGLVLEGWGRGEELALWVGVALWNAAAGPLFGSLLNWGQRHIALTTAVISFVMIFDTAGVPLFSAVLGAMVDSLGPHGLTLYAVGLPTYVIVIVAVMKMLIKLG